MAPGHLSIWCLTNKRLHKVHHDTTASQSSSLNNWSVSQYIHQQNKSKDIYIISYAKIWSYKNRFFFFHLMKTLYKMLGYFDMRVLSEKVWLPVAGVRLPGAATPRWWQWWQTADAARIHGNSCCSDRRRYCCAYWRLARTVSTVISYV